MAVECRLGVCMQSVQDTESLQRRVDELCQRAEPTFLQQWLQHELQGYTPHDAIPWYRIIPCHSVGVFVDLCSGEQCLQHIEHSAVEHVDREHVSYFRARQPLEYYQQRQDTLFRRPWNELLVAKYAYELRPNFRLVAAWKETDKRLLEQIWHGINSLLTEYGQRAEGERLSVAQAYQHSPWGYSYSRWQKNVTADRSGNTPF